MATWLDELKAGDPVFVAGAWGGVSARKIDRTTPSLIIVGNQRFSRSTGRSTSKTGGRFDIRASLEEFEKDRWSKLIQEREDQRAIVAARSAMHKPITPDQARAILKILETTNE